MMGYYLHKETDPYTNMETKEYRNSDINILEMCSESEEIEMFEAESI